ncbi:MAG: hypothetical protein LAN61_01825 [Acidobacteriia bacterium]|nr:hypothetical protein [Terriglobia bacterium]
MLFALLLLLSPLPQSAPPDAPEQAVATTVAPAAPSVAPDHSAPSANPPEKQEALQPTEISYLPGQLTPLPLLHTVGDAPALNGSAAGIEALPGSAIAEPAAAAPPRRLESPVRHRVWYSLAIAGHSAAAFDAWSTRRALSHNYAQEANPLLRPFAHSNVLYVAVQASPALMDYLGHRMMTSRRPWLRRMWWLPQSVGTAMSLGSGVHNTLLGP